MDTPLYTVKAGFNKAAIMSDAWARTRNQGRKATVEARRAAFAFNLRAAWNHARNLRKYAADRVARVQADAERAAAIAIMPRAARRPAGTRRLRHRLRRPRRFADARCRRHAGRSPPVARRVVSFPLSVIQ